MFKGVYTPMITIFDNEGNFDKESNKIMIEKLISDGIYGICLLGTTGEFFNMSFEEKLDYIRFASETISGRVKFIVGVGSTNIKETLALISCAEENNADAVLALPPFYFKLDDNHIYEYFSIIAKSTKLPIILYNIPNNTKVNLSAELVLKLANNFESIANGGVKDTTESLGNIRRFVESIKKVHKNFSVFSGIDEYLIPNLMIGGDGIIGTQTNTQAKLLVDTFKAFHEKDFEKLLCCQKEINRIMAVRDMPGNNILSTKTAVSIALDLDFSTSLRYYNITSDEDTKKRIGHVLKP
ncbi:dihydrodipicolinate synthase family protein [Clostridium arbusti]|uniref:dihydrodipicolinate synthase family protein n=1 Tax=Clostridium arbusti TaxID=1137848 RepID=UPI000288BC9C|nr:dihydrodipicolinate synthase family protein [Clostridium arbusti]